MENDVMSGAAKAGVAATVAISEQPAFKVWQCILCAFSYDEEQGLPAEGIPPGTRWADVPADWVCPDCSATKADFDMVEI
jgi:rubredoxin